jgi:hypothetical protein
MNHAVRLVLGLALLAGAGAAAAAPAPAPQPPTDHFPFVGCPADGQTGPRPAPAHGPTPLNWDTSGRLAYYSAGELGALAPRGWHCVQLYGSNGTTLIITPDQHDPADFIDPNIQIDGPGMVLTTRYGGTSGRGAVAAMIARHFPRYRSFIRDSQRAGLDLGELPGRPHPDDRVRPLGRDAIAFTTPAGKEGLGTASVLAAGDAPIYGIVLLFPDEEMMMIEMTFRLPAAFDFYQGFIVDTFVRQRGGRDHDR